jgi:hypothetical protein
MSAAISPIGAESSPLTEAENEDLVWFESVIETGITTWIEVGNALLGIRDRKLYRIEHSTFEDYCRSKWNIDRTYAHRLMSGAEVVNANKDLLPTGNISERAVREAAKVKDPVKQREVIKKAVIISGGKTPTAKTVKVVVEQQEQPIKQAEAKVIEGEVVRKTSTLKELDKTASTAVRALCEAAIRSIKGNVTLEACSSASDWLIECECEISIFHKQLDKLRGECERKEAK